MTNGGSGCCGVAFTVGTAVLASAVSSLGAAADCAGEAAFWAGDSAGFWVAEVVAEGFLAPGGVSVLNKYGVTNITAPISRKASRSRISIDISFGFEAGLLLPPFTDSAIQISVHHTTARDRYRPHERDGIWRGGAGPSTIPVLLHTARPLPACSPSRSDKSGRRRAARGIPQLCIREAGLLRSIASQKEPLHFPL